MSNLIEDVEAPKKRIIKYKDLTRILESKDLSLDTLYYLKKLINKRDVIDTSGYSGNSTIIIPKDSNNEKGYCIKVSDPEWGLYKEKVLLNLFSKYGLTSEVVNFIQDNKDILITEKVEYPWAIDKYTTIDDMANFLGKTLRKFHDIKWNIEEFTEEELQILKANGRKIIDNALKHEEGLRFMADYQNDHDYNQMKEYIKANINDYKDDDVIIHGDYNPINVFVKDSNSAGFVDVTDSGFGDRHYDLFWTIWTSTLYLGINSEKDKTTIWEDAFLNAYGRDKVDEKRLTLCKKINCMYWQEHNDINYFR